MCSLNSSTPSRRFCELGRALHAPSARLSQVRGAENSLQRNKRSVNVCSSNAIANSSGEFEDSISGAKLMAVTGMTAAGTKLTSKELSTLTVRDMMTAPALSLSPETAVVDAMSFLVEQGISGVPVVDGHGTVLGVCSGYDLLALDCTPGKLDKSFFPPIDTCINEFGGDRKMMWSTFKQLRQKLQAADCNDVAGVMHRAFTISPDAPMEQAANLVVQKGAHRICVVSPDNKLVGIVSRGDIMRATIANFKAYMSRQDTSSVNENASKSEFLKA